MSHQFIRSYNVKCSLCHLKNICIPTRLMDSEIEHLEQVIQKRVVFKKGETLHISGEKFGAIYMVSSGSFKSLIKNHDGSEKITNFFLPGEIVGLNSIGVFTYQSDTIALETASVCKIDFNQLEDLMRYIPILRQEMLSLMSKEIRQEQDAIGIISHGDATQRMISFLLNLSARLHSRGLSGQEFQLSMTRADIGNYLGLANETVSRQLTRLVELQLIDVEDKVIRILSADKMEALLF